MEFSIKAGDLTKLKTDCIMVNVFAARKLSPAAALLDKACKGAIGKVLASGDLGEKAGSCLLLRALNGIAAARILLVRCGAEKDYDHKAFVSSIQAGFKALKSTHAADVVIPLEAAQPKSDLPFKAEQTVIAALDSAYRFEQLKSEKSNKPVGRAVTFHVDGKVDDKALQNAFVRGEAIAAGMSLTKDLGNLPPNICTPSYLADTARQLAKVLKFKCTILEKKDMETLGMNTLLAVSKGSYQPPKFIVLEHHGGKKGAAPIVLVGKGITFDTGGISIKPSADMDEMKYDMGGAAAMLGTMRTIGLLKLPLNVVMLVPTCENMPGGNATRPGDIVKSMSGQTIEILNTDAEGRLILCDALTYAERYQPAAVVDAATLTGAMVIALGYVTTGVFANDDSLAQELVEAGKVAHDAAWHLPMGPEYDENLKSNFADIPNIGQGRAGGAITAACYLGRFTKAYKWAHMDIAGTAWHSGNDKGSTGRPVPLLANFLLKRAGL